MSERKHYLSPRWSGEVADCAMPMTFDQYNNCAFKCLYCFSFFQRAINLGGPHYLQNEHLAVSIARVKRIFDEPDSSQFGTYIKERKVLQWGGLSDPFCYFEKSDGVGLEILKFLREKEYPISFSTKGTWWLKDKRYTDLFQDNPNWNVKFSIITLDEAKAKAIERGVSAPSDRLAAIEAFTKLNAGGATLRFRPFIFGVSEPRHQELVREAAHRGATAVSLEFFCLEQRSPQLRERLRVVSDMAGFDYHDFYRKYSRGGGYQRLNRNIKRRFVDEIEAATREAGLRFYVSDAHFKERSDNGCCCGLPENWNYSRGQFCEALVICRRNGQVCWPEIAWDMEHLKGFMWNQAEGYNTNTIERRAEFHGFTMFDFMRWLWNNPKAGQSPYRLFEGVMKPAGLDDNGDLVYTLDKTRL